MPKKLIFPDKKMEGILVYFSGIYAYFSKFKQNAKYQ